MLELFLPIDEKRHNSFIYHHADMMDQLDRRKILACQNEFSKKIIQICGQKLNSNLNPNKKIKKQ